MPSVPQELVGTIPGWITSASVVTLVIAYWRNRATLRGLSNVAETDIRKHWSDEVKALRERLDAADGRYGDLMRQFDDYRISADKRHAECVAERDEIRDQLNAVKVQLEGVKAQIRASSTERVLFLEENCVKPSEAAPHSLAAAKRLKENGNGK